MCVPEIRERWRGPCRSWRTDAPTGDDLLAALFPSTGRAWTIGITGPPGAGKSTLVDQLVATAASARHQTVGILAVDPTSPFTGGAILGDRVRMQSHASRRRRVHSQHGHARPPRRARAGDRGRRAGAGRRRRDYVIIETVGVGQDEVDIVRLADVSVVTLVPGTGDDVQALKAGIMEIADVFVVNKADREGADRMVSSIEAMLSLQTVAGGRLGARPCSRPRRRAASAFRSCWRRWIDSATRPQPLVGRTAIARVRERSCAIR